MKLTPVHSWQTQRTRALTEQARGLGRHTFNPSIARVDDALVLAVRVSDTADGAVGARLRVLDDATLRPREGADADLAGWGAEHGVSRVADPKLFRYRGGVWATFNTGWAREGNDVYVMQVHPRLGAPIRCELTGRRAIEKNWGFFEGAGGELHAVYELDPLTVLRFGVVEPDATSITGSVVHSAENRRGAGLTIGTQPAVAPGGMILIAHQRVGVRKFRGYLGRAVRLTESAGQWRAQVGGRRLIHDPRTVLGTRPRRNRHLWFATYFSGIDVHGDTATLSYGINDQAANVVTTAVSGLG